VNGQLVRTNSEERDMQDLSDSSLWGFLSVFVRAVCATNINRSLPGQGQALKGEENGK